MSSEQPIGISTAGSSAVSGSAGGRSGAGSASSMGESGGRDAFERDELAIVLSHFDLGVVNAIQDFPRGSRRAPKLLVKSDRGVFLLKRRAKGKDNPQKVAFCHQLQLYLMSRQFPLPHLIGTRAENHSMLQLDGRIYEVFEYINGQGYDSSLDATQDAGKTLGLFHKLVKDYNPDYETPSGAYHASKHVANSIKQMTATMTRVFPAVAADPKQAEALAAFMNDHYRRAAKKCEEAGLSTWPPQIIHSDWHPGNMLFRGTRVVAVIDYDAARLQQPIIDAANGALQFSILGGGEDPSKWPDFIDATRFKRFLRGYDSVSVLSKSELRVLPWLMVEALIAEAVIPIAANGFFSRMPGPDFLRMIHRKVRWLEANAEQISTVLGT